MVADGLMRLPIKLKSDDFLTLPAPHVAIADIQAVIRAERDALPGRMSAHGE